MSRKPRFPTEPATRPDARRRSSAPPARPLTHQSGPAPKDARERAEAPTVPPPPTVPSPAREPSAPPRAERGDRTSDVRVRRGARSDMPAATVDEVTADLSRDPRRE